MGQALYRKYRSKSLAEIVGQEHITETLRRAIETGRVSHAYLFTGPRGVGKTSIARILAHELNGVPYTGEDNYLDIIEIDAASNGGVEEIRDLRDKVYITPTSGKYKVYIIDEVHMMTTSAFNALLKTLEEPPAHAVFILATTEAHKLPATIISRTQRYAFKPIEREKVVAHLRTIASSENITITDDALELIAEHGEGSFRDSISMLDQASSSGQAIDRTTVEKLLGIPPSTVVEQLITLLGNHDTPGLVSTLGQLWADGYQAAGIAKQLGQTLRAQLIQDTCNLDRTQTIAALSKLIDVPASHNPAQLLELILIEVCLSSTMSISSPVVAPTPATPSKSATTQQPTNTPKKPQAPKDEKKTADAAAETPSTHLRNTDTTDSDSDVPAGSIILSVDQWQTLLDAIKKQYNTLYGIIRMARPEFTPGKVTLTFGFAFHQKRANDAKNKKILTTILEEMTGERVAIDCQYDKTATPPGPSVAQAPAIAPGSGEAPAALGAISNIFGGGEVLQA